MLPNAPADLSSPKSQRWTQLAIAALFCVGGVSAYQVWQLQAPAAPKAEVAVVTVPRIKTVTALGRLEPQGEVIKLSAPTSNNGNRVEQLLVNVGDRVRTGQVIAVLDSRDRLQAALEQAQAEVEVAQAQLAITQAGAKQGEISAQQAEIVRLEAKRQGDVQAQNATIARLESEVRNAQTEFNRYQSLYQEGALAASALDSKRLTLETAQRSWQEAQAVLTRIQSTSPAELNQARANLDRIAEVRPVDIQAKQVEVNRAIAAMKQAKANLEQAYVRVPERETAVGSQVFEILAIHAYPGEVVSNEGIAEIGQTQRMKAIAEVYQSDISKVRVGQRVKITSDSIPDDLLGTVERIDSQIQRQTIVNTDPSANIDGRVIEVHVALDTASSQKAAKLTNLQVTTVIEQ
ncbi:MAG: ABC exporter membrane fusion protein [Trichocoleus desertorum ATA4-8-CV12]|jgi:HlyD family secretion protein|nr:ABC exporter membrane fusion protein [Trichocoleus desertorum ATA4-8-CV12]